MAPLLGRNPAQDHIPNRPEQSAIQTVRAQSLLLLRTAQGDVLGGGDLDALAARLESDGSTVTVSAAASALDSPDFWPRLWQEVAAMRTARVSRIRLLLDGTGEGRTDRSPLGRRVAEHWNITVDAPCGTAILVPGGSLFVVDPSGVPGSWRRFVPGQPPLLLGPRVPEPSWESSVEQACAELGAGGLLQQIPAGVLVRSPRSDAAHPGDLFHAVPMSERQPTVVVVPDEDGGWPEPALVTEVLSQLARPAGPRVRLAPAGPGDLLDIAQAAADVLGVQVELCTGLPLQAAAGGQGGEIARSIVIGTDAAPAWAPFVDAVVCSPRPDQEAPTPRLLRWTHPAAPSKDASAYPLSARITDDWQATVTRAGLSLTAAHSAPAPLARIPVRPQGPVIEVGSPGQTLKASAWSALGTLLDLLPPDLRQITALHVHGTPTDAGRELRLLAARHNMPVLQARPPATPSPATASTPDETGPPKDNGDPDTTEPAQQSRSGTPSAARTPARATDNSERWEPPSRYRFVPLLLGDDWEAAKANGTTASHLLADLPPEQGAAARTELAALAHYLSADATTPAAAEPWRHRELDQLLRQADAELLGYADCLTAALLRLPAHQGVVLRGSGRPLDEGAIVDGAMPRQGTVLRDAAPLGCLRADDVLPKGSLYAVLSVTGRSLWPVLGGPQSRPEVLFAPGTAFRVLGGRIAGRSPVVLLRELTTDTSGTADQPFSESPVLDDTDLAALGRLDEALHALLHGRSTAPRPDAWPPLCCGPIGAGP